MFKPKRLKIKNSDKVGEADSPPVVFYGLHMAEGAAQYESEEEGKEGKMYNLLITQEVLKTMNKTFVGKPVSIDHIDYDEFKDLAGVVVGWVIESFYNEVDGKHWAKFIVFNERAKTLIIEKGWKLSNCYIPTEQIDEGGRWHGMDYEIEVLAGEYDHLAITDKPRYTESIVLNEDQFKQYCERQKINNSLKPKKGNEEKVTKEKKPMFKLFKKEPIKNTDDVNIEEMSVELPKSKREVPLAVLIKNADEEAMNEDKPKYANGDHLVNVDGKEVKVNTLVESYKKANAEKEAKEKEEAEKKALENGDEEDEDELENEDEEDKKENKGKKKNKLNNALNALEAKARAASNEAVTVETTCSKLARGQNRYGSK